MESVAEANLDDGHSADWHKKKELEHMPLRDFFRRLWGRQRHESVLSEGDAAAEDARTPSPAIPATQDLPEGYKFIRATTLLSWNEIPSHADIEQAQPEAWYPADQPPKLALFVSHRWDTRTHPDPSRKQLRTLKLLLIGLRQIVTSMKSPANERTLNVPSLWRHGYLQASAIIGAAQREPDDQHRVWNGWRIHWKESKSLEGRELGDALIGQIGFWYDYACMPQLQSSVAREERALSGAFEISLYRLNELVAACPVISLRTQDDDYGARGWCAAEMAIGNGRDRHITVRMDLPEAEISRRDVLADTDHDPAVKRDRSHRKALSFDFPMRSMLVDEIDKWSTGMKTSFWGEWEKSPTPRWDPCEVFDNYWELRELEDGRQTPLFTSARPPATYSGHREMLIHELETTSQWSRADAEMGTLNGADLERFVRQAMSQANLDCSEDFDLVLVGLIILRERRSGSPTMAEFYDRARERWLSGKTLRLARYRHDLEPYEEKVWYLLEDEAEDTRPMPTWL